MKPNLSSLLILSLALSCSGDSKNDGDPDGAPVDFDRKGLLTNAGSGVILPVYEAFASESDALVSAVSAYCDGIGGADEATLRDAARTAWDDAMDTWQWAEVMLIGPASPEGDAVRDIIYSWPVISACAVDQDVVGARDGGTAFDITTRLPNRRGLDSLEYLLYSEDLDSSCPPQAQPAGWAELSDGDKRAARCAFALIAAGDLAAQADVLVDAWSPSGGDFAGDLASAGESGSSFATQDDALNAVFGALFYIDTKTKDLKLAKPAGLVENVCGASGEVCVAELESPHARRSKQNVAANLRGFEMLFFGKGPDGTDGLGFDDYLDALGESALAQRFATDLAAAITAVEGVPGTLRDAVESDRQSVIDAHAGVREVTNALKNDAPGVLGLEIPSEAGGDTD